jgi:hypothetical protein|nr:MAG TPA: antirestriction protein [Caudoviricetes sp.]
MNTILNKVMVYVGTYKKYNEGNIFGEWLTLGDYIDYSEFIQACRELHEDEEEPELMFQDWECPEELQGFISEVGLDENLFLLNDVQEDEEHVIAYLEYAGEITEKRIEEARDNYIGEFNDYDDLGRYFVEINVVEVPESLKYYINYEDYGRDISYDLVEVGNHYFWN